MHCTCSRLAVTVRYVTVKVKQTKRTDWTGEKKLNFWYTQFYLFYRCSTFSNRLSYSHDNLHQKNNKRSLWNAIESQSTMRFVGTLLALISKNLPMFPSGKSPSVTVNRLYLHRTRQEYNTFVIIITINI